MTIAMVGKGQFLTQVLPGLKLLQQHPKRSIFFLLQTNKQTNNNNHNNKLKM